MIEVLESGLSLRILVEAKAGYAIAFLLGRTQI